jgi:hypothetical protein
MYLQGANWAQIGSFDAEYLTLLWIFVQKLSFSNLHKFFFKFFLEIFL